MATTLAFDNAGKIGIKRITLSSTVGNLTQLVIPAEAKLFTIQPITSAVKLATTGTDAAAIGSDYMTLTAGVAYTLTLSGGGHNRILSLYVAPGTASSVIEVIIQANKD